MDSARPVDPSQLCTFEEAAQKIAVSFVELKELDRKNLLKPSVAQDGNLFYTQEQLDSFLANKDTLLSQIESSLNVNGGMPGRATNVAENTNLRRVGTSSGRNLYQKILQWIGYIHYNDDYAEDYSKSLSSNDSEFRPPSIRTLAITTCIAIVIGTIAFTQAVIKSNQPSKVSIQQAPADRPSVLGSETSKLKLVGNIHFRLPLVSENEVKINKTLEVAGKSVFKSDITAPNVLYGIKAGTGVVITNAESQTPTISVNVPTPIAVTSFQGLTGDVVLKPGTNITIDGTTISDTVTLTKLAAAGDCNQCILAPDVAQNLTISSGGNVSADAITSGLLTTSVGGTGLTTYNTGDLLYAQSGSTLASLPIGSDGDILQVSAGIPAWSTVPLNGAGSGPTTSGASLVGVYSNTFAHSSGTNLQNVLSDFDTALSNAGVSPFVVGNDIATGNFIYPSAIANNFVLGGNTPATSSLFFNQASANLTLGTAGSKNGTITIASTGSTNPTLTTNANGNFLIPNSNVGIGTTPSDLDVDNNPFILEVHGSIGPDQDGVYDLGSPTKQFRNLYITGQTTSGGNITISNPAPEISFI